MADAEDPGASALDPGVIAAALAAGRRARGGGGPRAPNAAVLHSGGRVLEVAGASAAQGALTGLSGAAESAASRELFLLLEPEPGEVDAAALRGLARVRVAIPDPGLGGRGLEALRAAGTEVEIAGATREVLRHLEPWCTAARLGRPFVLLKSATSLDGRIATRTGASQWITGPEARARGRALRGELDAILVGIETVLADDPQLTARAPGAADPLRVVLDARARTPVGARLVCTASEVPSLIAVTSAAPLEKVRALEAAGARVESLPASPEGRVDLHALLARLFGMGVRSLLVEGGAQVAGSFVDRGLVDRVAWFVAPLVLGGADARSAIGGRGAGPLSAALRIEDVEIERLGSDLLVTGRAARAPVLDGASRAPE